MMILKNHHQFHIRHYGQKHLRIRRRRHCCRRLHRRQQNENDDEYENNIFFFFIVVVSIGGVCVSVYCVLLQLLNHLQYPLLL